jgi:hypothetical protein
MYLFLEIDTLTIKYLFYANTKRKHRADSNANRDDSSRIQATILQDRENGRSTKVLAGRKAKAQGVP